MNPLECGVVLRPRDPLAVLDLTFRLAQEGGTAFTMRAGWLLGPILVACAVLSEGLGLRWAAAGLALLLVPVVQVPFTALGAGLLFPGSSALGGGRGDLLRVALFRALLTPVIVLGSVLSVGLLLPVLPVLLWLVGEVTLLERSRGVAALLRSIELAAEVGVTLPGVVLSFVFMGWAVFSGEVLGHAVVAGVFQLGTPFGSVLDGQPTLYMVAGLLAVQPWVALHRLLVYVDVRTRREGWDLQVQVRALGEAG